MGLKEKGSIVWRFLEIFLLVESGIVNGNSAWFRNHTVNKRRYLGVALQKVLFRQRFKEGAIWTTR